MGIILNDKELASDIQTTLCNLKSASKKLYEDLEAMQHNFLLKGYFKNKQKSTTVQ
jgi:phospholipid/cholesterol/gamma-HCH transport system substrate-binding protein